MVTTVSIMMQTQQSYDRRHDSLYTDANTIFESDSMIVVFKSV
jgi:hypothetical protein